jgi:hypothetical protein
MLKMSGGKCDFDRASLLCSVGMKFDLESLELEVFGLGSLGFRNLEKKI